jgi:hypothetical protein
METIFENVKNNLSKDIKQSWIEYYDKYGAIKLK